MTSLDIELKEGWQMLAWTCQRDVPSRLKVLPSGLIGSWDRVAPWARPAYQEMVAVMEAAGVPTNPRPPVWAWIGPAAPSIIEDRLTLLLSNYEQELSQFIVEFDAPERELLMTDYSKWCDYYSGVLSSTPTGAPTLQRVFPDPAGDQVTCGALRTAWITNITTLNCSDWSLK